MPLDSELPTDPPAADSQPGSSRLSEQLVGAADRQRDAKPGAAVRRALTSIRPSCASTILRTIASPRPEPCGLVVKNGLKILSIDVGRHARGRRR